MKHVALTARVVLGALTLAALAASVFAFTPPSPEGTRMQERPPPPGLAEPEYDGELSITIERLDLQSGAATLSMFLDLNEQWAEVRGNLGLDVVLQGLAADDSASGRMTFWPEGGSRSLSLTLPGLAGDTDLYPLDDHGISIHVTATAPAGVPLPPLAGAPRDGRDLRLAITHWQLGDGMREWEVRQSALRGTNLSNTEPGSEIANLDDPYTVFFLERSTSSVVFIGVVAATPFLLVLAFVVGRFSTGRTGDTQTSPLELSAALLAVITLRQVLIPADISGFTLLDKVLGFEVVALVAITVFVHVVLRPAGLRQGAA